MKGLSSNAKEFSFSPGSFIDGFRKLQHVSLPSLAKNKLVLGQSFGRFSKFLCLRQCNLYLGLEFLCLFFFLSLSLDFAMSDFLHPPKILALVILLNLV